MRHVYGEFPRKHCTSGETARILFMGRKMKGEMTMGKVWFITGSNRGLGRAFAKEASARGDQVVAAARKVDGDDPFYRNGNVLGVELDVTRQSQIDAAVAAAIERFGRIDVLVNNAGFGMSGAFEEASDAELRALFDTDYFGVVNVTKAVLPHMRAQKGGMILSVSSQGGLMGFTGSSAYCSAKFAVVGLTMALVPELAPFGIQVSVICPGAFRTDFRDASSMRHPTASMEAYEGTPVRASAKYLAENNHKQAGDPAKAAKFVADVVDSGTLPKRLLIGGLCCEQVRDDLNAQLAEISSYEVASSQTDFDE